MQSLDELDLYFCRLMDLGPLVDEHFSQFILEPSLNFQKEHGKQNVPALAMTEIEP